MSDIFEKASKAGADTFNTAAETAKSEGSTMMRLWQENANRMLRANERMMHGMLTALKLEFQLGQDLMEHRINTFKAASQAEKPSEAGHTVMDRHLHEMERLVASMREISEEMRNSFGDATKLMFYDLDQHTKEIVAAATAKPPATTSDVPAPVATSSTAVMKFDS
jgi:hypothetical protein